MDLHIILLGLIVGLNYQVNSQPDFKDKNKDMDRARAHSQPLNSWKQQPRTEFSQLNSGQFVPQTQQQLPQQPRTEFSQLNSGQFVPQTQQQLTQQPRTEFGQLNSGQFVPQTQQQLPQQPRTEFGQLNSGQFVPQTQQQLPQQPRTEFSQLNSGQFVPQTQQQLSQQPRTEFSQLNPGQFVPQTQQQLPQPRMCTKKDVFAVCNMVANPNRPSNINGTLYFMQPVTDDCTYDFLSIQVNIDNVPVNDGTMEHGLHVHQFGDMRNGCESMGPHFNPYNRTHGSPWNPSNARHVGDLGNVMQTPRGNVNTRVVDYLASLLGEDTIIGRGMVLHAGRDDLGLNRDNPESLKTGNAGGRLACCVIGVSPPIPRDMFSLYGKR